MTTLYGWGPMFGVAGPSPFVLKCDTQLQMLGVEFDRAIADLQSVSKGKAPYVEDNGEIIQDSSFIRRHFESKLGHDLDAGLSVEQKAIAAAFERLLEDRLVPVLGCERWLVDANFEKGPAHFFDGVPEPMRKEIVAGVRKDFADAQRGQGMGRHSREERLALAEHAIGAMSDFLGEKDFMFGDQPKALDAVKISIIHDILIY